MRKLLFGIGAIFVVSIFPAFSQENPFDKLEIIIQLIKPPKQTASHRIESIQTFGESSGIAQTGDAIYKTDDKGKSWRKLKIPKNASEIIVDATFYSLDSNLAIVLLANNPIDSFSILKTNNGGASWIREAVNVSASDLAEADIENTKIRLISEDLFELSIRLESSSNFSREAHYASKNGGLSWSLESRESGRRHFEGMISNTIDVIVAGKSLKPQLPKDEVAIQSSNLGDSQIWYLTSKGECAGFKSGCFQEQKLYGHLAGAMREITPPQIKASAAIEKQKARLEASNSIFAQPPGGSSRISLNRGFDKCTAATSTQMQTWWDTSPFYDVNIYIGGINRGCSQPQLTQAWVNAVSAQGWGLIPTWVGPQAPCTTCTTCANRHSSDPATAETEGRTQADLAIAAANNLGLTSGTIIYYDMERYADTGCGAAVNSFLKGWTDRLKEQGYKSGAYGSPTNANIDWRNIAPASKMDAIWMARWDNNPSVWATAPANLPTTEWANYQRIKQFIGPRNETWGGVTFNIDNNYSEGPVAATSIARNKTADFDGDGKTDVSIYRPDASSVWYVLNSSIANFSGNAFGVPSDITVPGDYDGDGRTDYAIFRPSEANWYIQSRNGFLRVQRFGAASDIPAPADYNGDGLTDIAVFRPSEGNWYIWRSSGSPSPLQVIQFGQSGDRPAQADYDGDGKADTAIWRGGIWYVLRSSDGSAFGVQFGIPTDKPAQADYDGDGKTDFGVLRDGTWYLLQTQLGFGALNFGLPGDLPATGDYDGDNKADIAVFRPSTGVWYLLQSQNGFGGLQFGVSGDRPIPSAYLPQ